jgi:predicted aspartyl protease
MVCLNCQRANRQSAPIIKVWFLIDTGAAHTYIAKETIEKLTESDHIPESMSVAIQVCVESI